MCSKPSSIFPRTVRTFCGRAEMSRADQAGITPSPAHTNSSRIGDVSAPGSYVGAIRVPALTANGLKGSRRSFGLHAADVIELLIDGCTQWRGYLLDKAAGVGELASLKTVSRWVPDQLARLSADDRDPLNGLLSCRCRDNSAEDT